MIYCFSQFCDFLASDFLGSKLLYGHAEIFISELFAMVGNTFPPLTILPHLEDHLVTPLGNFLIKGGELYVPYVNRGIFPGEYSPGIFPWPMWNVIEAPPWTPHVKSHWDPSRCLALLVCRDPHGDHVKSYIGYLGSYTMGT